ncbi:hypothetical protein F0Q53_01770 [Anaplasma marginale]|uniref:Uncharacterized protein n=1 Tax=Anaplasma marginale TaxID=770 RepID=A0A643CLM2_ANAMA|nr:Mth938-like domain-containing protein [Anaplasma marginale]AAV86722.1 hypothetical protein AM790 [Anaplasma marginale str. St. Maries]KAA8474798.1 hypothetical protein F0Q53_01770 [Anaplasma marginale]KAB0452367.1 hypothetical protein FY207_01770 [Anaplasma marginale]KAB0453000.1 hypothetical protein FY192_01960 [Anaplasma marginale]
MSPSVNAIDSCDGECFVIRGTVYRGPAVVFPHSVVALPHQLELSGDAEAVLSCVQGDFRMVPIGVGGGFERFSRILSSRLQRSGVRHEVMSMAAACDMYNVLLHESEHVCAVLLLPL